MKTFWQGQYGSLLVYVSINDEKEEERASQALSYVCKICLAPSILKDLSLTHMLFATLCSSSKYMSVLLIFSFNSNKNLNISQNVSSQLN